MLNHIVIMGRLTRDPELRRVPSGSAVCSFTVAVDRDFQSRDSAEKQTDFIDCVAWEQRAEFVSKWFTKGRMIIVEGRLESRKWQDKAGQNRVSWQIRADRVHFGETKRDAYGDGGYSGAPGYGNNSGYGGGYNSGSGYGGYNSGYGNSAPGYGSNAAYGGSASASGYGNASGSGYGSSAPGYGGSSTDAPGYGGKSDYSGASAPASGSYAADGHDNAYTPPAETPPSDFAEIGDEDGDLPF